jgi:DNA mismatch endonuclease (patch repair protein)
MICFYQYAVDRLTPQRRSWNMSRIRGSDTGPEKSVRSLLQRMGFRFTLRRRGLPGRPDIVLPKWRTAVFVHGCFWHQHAGCRNAVMPKTRPDFWAKKLQGNVMRDEATTRALKDLGWRVITIWECELKQVDQLQRRLKRVLRGRAKR